MTFVFFILKKKCIIKSYFVSPLFQGLRFLQLKNPWSHLRWKGRYSENDIKSWTPELQKYLNFDPRTAQKIDNGKRSEWFLKREKNGYR